MGDLFNNKESQYGTEVEMTTTTVAPVRDEDYKTVQPFEGKSYAFRTQRYKAEDRPCIVNESNRVIPLDNELANSIVNSVSRAASLYSDVTGLESQVKDAIRRVMPNVTDGIITEGMVTLDNLAVVKETRKELNKLWEDLEKERKSGKAIITKPYDYINGMYKEKTSLLTTVLSELKSQIDRIEGEEDEKKAASIKAVILGKAGDYYRGLPELLEKYPALYNRVWSDKFLNKTCSDTKMQYDIMKALGDLASDLKALDGEKDSTELKASYFETGDLSAVLKKRQSMDEAREMIKRMSSPAPEPEKVSVPQPEVENAPSRAPEKPVVTLTDFGPGKDQYFHCWNANPEEFTGLISYMKAHGFRCEGIKKIVDYYKSLN